MPVSSSVDTTSRRVAPTAAGAAGEETPRRIPVWALSIFVLAVTGATLWPFWIGLAASPDRAFMLRDMMVPFDMAANDLVFGKGGYSPRAVPQDSILAVLSPTLPATALVAAVMLIGAAFGIVGAVKMARDMAGAGRAAQLVCGLFVVWNPYVIERLLQGQWSLTLAVMLLPAIAYYSASGFRSLQIVLITLAGLTPAGLVLAVITALVFNPTWRSRAITLVVGLAVAAPWLLVTLINSTPSRSSANGAEVFAVGPDGPLGTVVSVLGLGGIWNAGAIPPSRGLIGAVAGLALFAFAIWGTAELWRVYRGVAIVTGLALAVPLFLATPVGMPLMRWTVSTVPGVAMFRDTHKLVGLALPGMILLLAVCMQRVREKLVTPAVRATSPAASRLLGWIAPLAVGALVVATVPGYPADVAPTAPQRLSPAWAKIEETVSGAPSTKMLIFPPGNYRLREDGEPTLTPALKMMPGHPVDPQFLIVDGELVDGDAATIGLLHDAMQGKDELAANGVGWVLVDRTQLHGHQEQYRALDEMLSRYPVLAQQDGISLYRIPRPHALGNKESAAPAIAGMALYWLTHIGGLWVSLWVVARDKLREHRARSGNRGEPAL